MSEHDLGLKIATRELFWDMGLSTRLDVELRGHRSNSSPGAAQTFTDLDVLGISISPDVRINKVIADCKTSRRESTSRMFWVKGVSEFFGADHAYLVREQEVTDAARQLSHRLGIGVLTSSELDHLQKIHSRGNEEIPPRPGFLFDRENVERHLAVFNKQDRKLRKLLDYRQFDYWVNEPYRNLTILITHLREAASHLTAGNPAHRAIFLDLSWLYLLSLAQASEFVRGGFLGNIEGALQEYIFGGAAALREKIHTAAALNRARPDGEPHRDHLPDYFTPLRELVRRLLSRPQYLQICLRYLEIATGAATANDPETVPESHGPEAYEPIAAKLSADVCGFLVGTCDLDKKFRLYARQLLLGEKHDHSHQLSPVDGLSSPEVDKVEEARDSQLDTGENQETLVGLEDVQAEATESSGSKTEKGD
jgi:hypothetical protein